MKTTKRLLTIATAVLTVCAVSVAAFAADSNFGSDRSRQIKPTRFRKC